MSQSTPEAGAERPSLGGDLILPLFAVGLTVYYLFDTRALSWEAKATGFIVGIVLLTLSAVQVLRVLGQVLAGRAGLGLGMLVADTQDNRRRLAMVVLTALFITSIEIVGTTLGLFLLLLGGMLVMGVRSPVTLLAVAGTTSAVVYGLLIVLLGTRLPRGVIERLLATLGIGA